MMESQEDLAALRSQVRELVGAWRAAGRFRPRPDAWLRSFDRDFSRALGERGLLGVTWPREVGGGGRSNIARLVITEELLRAGAPVAAHWIAERQIGPEILRYGRPELREEFLPGIARGEITVCLGMSETESGSDLASVRTRAVRDGDGWRITGTKIWTSHAHHSQYAYVLARTDPDAPKHESLTEFIVDLDAEGVEVRPIIDLCGEHHFNELHLDGVWVPGRRVLGEPGRGWEQVTSQLAFERGGAERYMSTYPIFEQLLAELDAEGAPAGEVGRLVVRLRALRTLAWDTALAFDRGEAPVGQAAMLKYLGTRLERDIVEVARALTGCEPAPGAPGLAGMIAEGILAAPGFSIRGGTSEVLTTILARGEAEAAA